MRALVFCWCHVVSAAHDPNISLPDSPSNWLSPTCGPSSDPSLCFPFIQPIFPISMKIHYLFQYALQANLGRKKRNLPAEQNMSRLKYCRRLEQFVGLMVTVIPENDVRLPVGVVPLTMSSCHEPCSTG